MNHFPSELSNCKKLVVFNVGFNTLNGSIPSSYKNWTELSELILSENKLTGGIPSFLSYFGKLSVLELGGNPLGAMIPRSIGALRNPFYMLNLSNNGLTGELPREISEAMLELRSLPQQPDR